MSPQTYLYIFWHKFYLFYIKCSPENQKNTISLYVLEELKVSGFLIVKKKHIDFKKGISWESFIANTSEFHRSPEAALMSKFF